ncbi:hypothetical protein JI664_21490 [Rhodobacter sp. NTK016B]|uniref:hypothetical protein n=1 Tax=Rhodobacter sp. NTK016B TaxID=2759676 RepID=UPI001A8F0040|nr:hypothetical protein [Rhodobacter sp. NTK016B]MBN8294561.1 hypothetical protein [Rhodobacter sp. NTK016B]
MDDHKDPPIDAMDYLSGLKVVDIGDIRVARGKSRRPHSACKHRRLRYDSSERRIWCADCQRDVEGFDAFEIIAKQVGDAVAAIERREQKVLEAEAFTLRSRAAKAMDEAWRGRTMVPACPTCGHGLFPEMFARGGGTMLGRNYAEAKLKVHRERTKD